MSDEKKTNNPFEIRISGIDFGMAFNSKSKKRYYRLDDPEMGIFKKIGAIQDEENKRCYKYISENKKDVVFDISDLIELCNERNVTKKNIVHKYKEIGFSVTQCDIKGDFIEEWLYYSNFISRERLESIQCKFKNANVLFFSGHHEGDNYDHYYRRPGLVRGEVLKGGIMPSLFLQCLMIPINTSINESIVYDNVKLVIAVGCKYIRRNMFCLYKKLFPNAVILGYRGSGPADDRDQPFLAEFFKKMDWISLKKNILFDDIYKEKIVEIWKETIDADVENNRKLKPSYKSTSFCCNAQPGYYYSLDKKEDDLSYYFELEGYDYNEFKENDINMYYDVLGDKSCNLKKELYEMDGEKIKLSYNFLIDNAFISKFYSENKSEVEEEKSGKRCKFGKKYEELIDNVEKNKFFRYLNAEHPKKHPCKIKDNNLQNNNLDIERKDDPWHVVYPHGKLYYINRNASIKIVAEDKMEETLKQELKG